MSRIIIYQLLPRLFGNSTTGCVANGTIQLNGCGKFNDITAKALRAIRGLGATHVWYTGVIEHTTRTDYSKYGIATDHPAIVKGEAGSPYAIKDYYDIDPDLAVNVEKRREEFEALIERTHKTGLKVIMDFIPNHVARHYISDNTPEGTYPFGQFDDKEASSLGDKLDQAGAELNTVARLPRFPANKGGFAKSVIKNTVLIKTALRLAQIVLSSVPAFFISFFKG